MSERRMISKKIVDTDAFTEMSMSARLLYYELNWRADDDGFVASPKNIVKMAGCSDGDMQVLIQKRFVIYFESGIILIRDWKIHNYISKDRYNETKYLGEKSTVSLDENGSYTTCARKGIQPVHKMETQVRLGKVRLGKDRLGKEKKGIESPPEPLADLPQAIEEFKLFRESIKKPMTSHAVDLLIAKLTDMATTDHEKIHMINRSILNGWVGVFKDKDYVAPPKPQPPEEEHPPMTEEASRMADEALRGIFNGIPQ